MPEQIISASGTQHGLQIDSEGRAKVIPGETIPTDGILNNPEYKLEYDTDGNLGSITQFIGVGSYVQVLTWGGGSLLTNVGSYS